MIQISTDYHYIISNNILRQLRICDNIFFYQAWISDIYKFKNYRPVALFTKILTIKNCRKCKTKIKKSFTKILTIILNVKIVLTLRVKLFCRKCKILIVREIFVLSFIVSEKIK